VLHKFSSRIAINIELTNYRSPLNLLPDKVAQLIDAHGLQKDLLISSFNPLSLRRFHELKPEIQIGLLVKKGFLGELSRSKLGEFLVSYWSIHPEKNLVSQELINISHQNRKRIYPHTINSVLEMKRILSLKVDGIITDKPRTARAVINSLAPVLDEETSHPVFKNNSP
jgi:glycerophosphoryl diester phosphodiesterase